jgi:MoaA/NifB/PqqE/SkfB family radical SAM enzyme
MVPVDDFRHWVETVQKKTIYSMLYFQGEPWLHPNLAELISILKKYNIYTTTSTNGHFLTRENAEKMVEAGLDRLIISLDGTSQATYEKYREGGDLDKVLSGIKTIQSVKMEKKARNPRVIMQFLVNRYNEHQVKEARQLATKFNVDLKLKTMQVYDLPRDETWLPSNSKHSRYHKKNGMIQVRQRTGRGCRRLWTTAVITWEGNLVACCYDKNGDHKYGMITGENGQFAEHWRGNRFLDFRKTVLSGKQKIEICSNCPE